MPPKKATTGTNGDAAEGGKIIWEGANDLKLLLLTQGRYVKPDEYPTLASTFPGVTVGGIRNRISTLRVKQRNLYEERGWTLPEGAAGHSAKKRGAGGEGSPCKKARGKKVEKQAEVVEEEERKGGWVKEEPEEV
ncbi:hypothetical protein OPT61_g8501 [Boeremia exigua]|uniref:Uncharacterized protein n=1 Tax=Boeremia exigua TaxID=749465 RepID=A0ACC2HYJ8_9PLEO|nr:hypothetical protein OPT61_g8501 [Boeremia exigua]